jgi:hypothetical protein
VAATVHIARCAQLAKALRTGIFNAKKQLNSGLPGVHIDITAIQGIGQIG